MAIFDDEPKKPAKSRTRSARICRCFRSANFGDRIALLRPRSRGLEAELAAKGSTKAAAEALFRR